MKNSSGLIQYSLLFVVCLSFVCFLGNQKGNSNLLIPFALFLCGMISAFACLVQEIAKIYSNK
jgi:hypothetical protein